MSTQTAAQVLAPHLLSRDEVAECLGASISTVVRLEQRGELPRVKLGRLVRFRAVDVEALIARAYVGPANDEAPADDRGPVKTSDDGARHVAT